MEIELLAGQRPTAHGTKNAIVFVHGILGDSSDTWTSTDDQGNQDSWPAMMRHDSFYDHFDILVVGYKSSATEENLSVIDCAKNLNSLLHSKGILPDDGEGGYDQIVFICHSMGGIVAARAMTLAPEQYRNRTPLLFSVAVPWLGADMAWLASLLSSNPQWDSLVRGSKDTLETRKAWLDAFGSETTRVRFAVEARQTSVAWWIPSWTIVSKASAIGLQNTPDVTAYTGIEADHIHIAKPTPGNRHIDSYFRECLQKLPPGRSQLRGAADISARAATAGIRSTSISECNDLVKKQARTVTMLRAEEIIAEADDEIALEYALADGPAVAALRKKVEEAKTWLDSKTLQSPRLQRAARVLSQTGVDESPLRVYEVRRANTLINRLELQASEATFDYEVIWESEDYCGDLLAFVDTRPPFTDVSRERELWNYSAPFM